MNPEETYVSNICEQLLRNDPAVVEAEPCCTWRIGRAGGSSETMNRNLHEYLLALQHNTVVTVIKIHLNQFNWVEHIEAAETMIDRLQPLLYFLQHGPSLRKVQLIQFCNFTVSSQMQTLQLIVDATSKNPSLQSFDSDVDFFSPELVTSFLSAKPELQRLKVTIDLDNASGEVVERAARAIGSHPRLEDLSITTTDFLPFLQMLPSNSSLCGLALAMRNRFGAPDLSPLPRSLESLKKLTDLSLKCMDIDVEQWRLVSTGIQSSTSISSLSLDTCVFSTDAAELFLEDMASTDILRQPVRKLILSRSYGQATMLPLASVATMLRSSLIHHIVLENCGGDFGEFFGVLSTSCSVVPLRSIELVHWNPGVAQLSVFLPSAVYLGRLKIMAELSEGRHRRLQLPTAFLSSLRSNGSLCSVEILDMRNRLTLGKRAKRYIWACTQRNRELPKALRTLFGKKSKPSRGIETAPLPNRFPTLSVSAMQAPQMAPNNVLIGLLASLETFVPAAKRSDGKRVASQE